MRHMDYGDQAILCVDALETCQALIKWCPEWNEMMRQQTLHKAEDKYSRKMRRRQASAERQNTLPPRCLRTMIMAELSTGSYLFPEIYIHKDNCTLNIMIMVRWGVGVVMYEMMVGRLPFYNRHVFTFCSSSSSQLPSSPVII